jgi:glucose-1-phosphate cytidylyltransferase
MDYIKGDESSWEIDSLPVLAKEAAVHAFFHKGFWHPMDTLRDNMHLNSLWNAGEAPWALWSKEKQ